LGEVLPAVNSKMRWDDDFGDGWEHDDVVEAIEPMRSDAIYPVRLGGKRACPPDDAVVGRGATATCWPRSVTRRTRSTRS
jgi:Plasmid pRiA4b ORF-3-like protein